VRAQYRCYAQRTLARPLRSAFTLTSNRINTIANIGTGTYSSTKVKVPLTALMIEPYHADVRPEWSRKTLGGYNKMITKEQAQQLRYGDELHCEVVRKCRRQVGPRGGVKLTIARVRVSGQCQTWKTRPEEFRVPIKYGMYQSSEITHRNASDFHFPQDCPTVNPNVKSEVVS
jgi:hypothetical protein